MKKIFAFFMLMIIITLIGCQSKLVGHQIIGVWEHGESKIEFKTNGYFYKGNEKYKFTVTDKKVTIDKKGEDMVVDYTINSNGTLTFNNIIYYPVG